MDFSRTNWLAIAACVVAAMGIGFAWYGLLFVQQWMAGNGITMDEATMKIFKNGVEQPNSATPMIVNSVVMLVYAFIMNWLVNRTNSTTWMSGATVGLAVGVVGLLNHIVSNMFAFRASELAMVDGSYFVAVFVVMGAILGGWRKK